MLLPRFFLPEHVGIRTPSSTDVRHAKSPRQTDDDRPDDRGVARALQGNQASALQDYDEACRAQPDSAVAFHNRGIARELQGDLAGARQDYDEAIRLRPDDPMFTSNLYLRAGLSFAKADPGRHR